MATSTPKLDLLAQRFMAQIQDPVTVNGSGNLNVGNLVKTIPDMSRYCGDAMLKYIQKTWDVAQGSKIVFLKMLPELFAVKPIIFPIGVNNLDLTNPVNGNFMDVFDIVDSFQTNLFIEVWNERFLSGALSNTDPFHTASIKRPALIYSKPILYIFPTPNTQMAGATIVTDDSGQFVTDDSGQAISDSPRFTFNLAYIKLPVDPVGGDYLQIDGTLGDIPFTIKHIQEIADIAQSLYIADDMETSS
jgi:hypothetical protein